jgi:hypothetical protein
MREEEEAILLFPTQKLRGRLFIGWRARVFLLLGRLRIRKAIPS